MLIAYISDWTTTNGNARSHSPPCAALPVPLDRGFRGAETRTPQTPGGPFGIPHTQYRISAVHRCRRGFSLWRIARMWLAVSSPAVLPHIDPSRARLRGCSLLSELVPWQFTIHLAHASRPLSRPVVRIVG